MSHRIAVVCALFLVSGCDSLKKKAMQSAKQAAKASQKKEAAKGGGFFEDATSINPKFASAVGGAAKFLELNVYPGYAIAQIQDPKKHENVDGYELRSGSVENTGPVKFIGSKPPTAKDLDFICVDGATVDWTKVPEIIKDATAKVNVEGGHVSHLIFKRNLPFKKDPVWRVYVDGERRSGSAEYNIDGSFRKIY
jgi:hypothetical protein